MDNGHFLLLFDKLDKDRKGKKHYCDVTISVNNTFFSTHRCVLGTFSVYFATLFQSRFKSKNERIIRLPSRIGKKKGIAPRIFKSLLNYFYTGRISLTTNNVYDVLAATEFLEIDTLKTECLEFLKTILSPENWLKVFRIGQKWNHTSLIDYCVDYFLKADNKLDLKKSTFKELHSLVSRSSDRLNSEEKFEMITSWISANHQDDKKQQCHFDDLVQYVDFEAMKDGYVSNNIESNDLVKNSVVALQGLIARQKKKSQLDEKLLLLGGHDEDAEGHSVQKLSQGAWQKCADSQKPIQHWSSVASSGSHVFVIDGRNEESHLQVYDINKDTWSVVESILQTPRRGATAAIIGSKLYLFGGYRGQTVLSSAEVLDISECETTVTRVSCDDHRIPDLRVARRDHASVTTKHDSQVYFIAGATAGLVRLSSCESINVATCESSDNLPALHQARVGLSAVEFDNSIIAMGGWDEKTLDSVESLSLSTNQWTVVPPMAVPRYTHCTAVYNRQLFVIGGKTISGNASDIEVYDPNSNESNSFLAESRSGAHVVKW